MAPSDSLVQRWRTEAETLRKHGADQLATLLKRCADELQTARRELELEKLTLKEAEEESGYSYSALQKMVANGELENVGRKNSPRVRRGDLPRKVKRQRRHGEPDLVGMILKTSGN